MIFLILKSIDSRIVTISNFNVGYFIIKLESKHSLKRLFNQFNLISKILFQKINFPCITFVRWFNICIKIFAIRFWIAIMQCRKKTKLQMNYKRITVEVTYKCLFFCKDSGDLIGKRGRNFWRSREEFTHKFRFFDNAKLQVILIFHSLQLDSKQKKEFNLYQNDSSGYVRH